MNVVPPRQDAPIAGSDGKATRSFYSWIQALTREVATATTGATTADRSTTDIAAIATALGSEDGSVAGIPDQSASVGQVQAVEGETTTDGLLSNGYVQVGLADVADTGVGAALVKITRDGKGRVEGTEAATTADLTELTNLYYTDARADARIAADVATLAALTNAADDTAAAAAGVPVGARYRNGSALMIRVA